MLGVEGEGRVVCHIWCHITCPFGGCTIPRLTRQWTPYCTRLFIVLPTNTLKPNLREGALVERPRSDVLRARFVFCNIPYLHVSTWEAARATFQSAQSGAHMWNRRSLVSSHCV